MTHLAEERETAAPAPTLPRPDTRASLVLVAGSGRSGTSLFTGILQRLGFYVPRPEVPADETNPRGFGESQWVVDFHTRLLEQAGVQLADARPGAWAQIVEVSLDDRVAAELAKWLGRQFREADHVIIKDPRLTWFLPLWRRCAEELRVPPRFVTVLRHPAAVVQSKLRSYGRWYGDIGRTAGWINQTLFTERATREQARVFVRHEELLDDWTRAVARVGKLLDLALIRDAPAASIVRAHEFVDRSLSQSGPTWGELDIPVALREQADDVWELMTQLADDEAQGESLLARLDEARAAYARLYEEAEAIAQSSIIARRRRTRAADGRAARTVVRLSRSVPTRYRHKIPARWRMRIFRFLKRRGARGA